MEGRGGLRINLVTTDTVIIYASSLVHNTSHSYAARCGAALATICVASRIGPHIGKACFV